jgi:hypothetical protein
MNSQNQITNRAAVDEFSTWAVGLGILVVALAPLSIPILVLTAVALVPLAVPVIALGLVAAVVAVPIVVARRLVLRLRTWSARSTTDTPSPTFSVRGSHG